MFTHQAVWHAIDELAARKGWTVEHLTAQAGMAPGSLSPSKRSCRTGQRWPTLSTVKRLLTASDIALSDFVKMIELADRAPDS